MLDTAAWEYSVKSESGLLVKSWGKSAIAVIFRFWSTVEGPYLCRRSELNRTPGTGLRCSSWDDSRCFPSHWEMETRHHCRDSKLDMVGEFSDSGISRSTPTFKEIVKSSRDIGNHIVEPRGLRSGCITIRQLQVEARTREWEGIVEGMA